MTDLSYFGSPAVSNDWTGPLLTAAAAMTAGDCSSLRLPEGILNFETPLHVIGSDKLMGGYAPGVTTLLYQGSDRTSDLITIGDLTNPYAQTERFYLRDFKIDSAVVMEDGSALKLHKWVLSIMNHVSVGHLAETPKTHDGLHFSGFGDSHVIGFNVRSGGKGMKIHGLPFAPDPINGAWGAGLFFHSGKVALCGEFGVHIGGGAGGVGFSATDVIANASTGMLIDNQLVPLQNREVFAGNGSSFDSNGVYGIHVNDTMVGNGWLGFGGVWSCANQSHNIYISNWGTYGRCSLRGATMQLSRTGDGLRVEDNTCVVDATGASIFNNMGYAINDVGNGYNIDYSNTVNCHNNVKGFYRAGSTTIEVPIKRERKFTGNLNSTGKAAIPHSYDFGAARTLSVAAVYLDTNGAAVAIPNVVVDNTNININAGAGGANRPCRIFAVFETIAGG